MKVVTKDGKTTVYTFDSVNTNNINDYMKKLLLKLKKKYGMKFTGFYQINIYQNNLIGLIIDIIKDDDEDYFYDLVDLKIKVYEDSNIYLKFNDYFFNAKKELKILNNNYYILTNNIDKSDFMSMIEFGELIYGKEAEMIKEKLSCLTK